MMATAYASHLTSPYAGSASSPPPQPFTGYQQPPQLAYGWWVDMLPPRGPYLWPCINPSTYSITEPVHLKEEVGGGAPQTAAAKAGESTAFLSQPPQMCYGWYVSSPPPSAPFFWSCIPPGYALVPLEQLKLAQQQQTQRSALPLTTTTRQGNVTLTLPTTSSALSSSTPSPLPTSDLSAPTPSSSVSSFYPPSKLMSILPPSLQAPSQSDSLGFLNLSSQPDDPAPPTSVPLPVRSPALEGLANVAVPGGGGGDFVLDQAPVVEQDAAAAVGEEEVEEGGGGGGGRRGKRKRTGKGR